MSWNESSPVQLDEIGWVVLLPQINQREKYAHTGIRPVISITDKDRLPTATPSNNHSNTGPQFSFINGVFWVIPEQYKPSTGYFIVSKPYYSPQWVFFCFPLVLYGRKSTGKRNSSVATDCIQKLDKRGKKWTLVFRQNKDRSFHVNKQLWVWPTVATNEMEQSLAEHAKSRSSNLIIQSTRINIHPERTRENSKFCKEGG